MKHEVCRACHVLVQDDWMTKHLTPRWRNGRPTPHAMRLQNWRFQLLSDGCALAKIHELQAELKEVQLFSPIALLLPFSEETSNFHDVINWLLPILQRQLVLKWWHDKCSSAIFFCFSPSFCSGTPKLEPGLDVAPPAWSPLQRLNSAKSYVHSIWIGGQVNWQLSVCILVESDIYTELG